MSLWFVLRAGMKPIGTLEVRRVTNAERGDLEPDDVSEYEINLDTPSLQAGLKDKIEHRYGDGPWVLLRKALEAITDEDS